MKKTFDQLVAEGKRKRAERLQNVTGRPLSNYAIAKIDEWLRNGNPLEFATKRSEPIPIRNAAFGLLQSDGTITNITPITRFMHKFFEETALPLPIVKESPDDNAD